MRYLHVTLPCTGLSYAFKSNVRLACGNLSFPFPDSCLHLQTDDRKGTEVCLFVQAAKGGSAEQTPMLRSSSPEKCKTEQRASQFNCEFAGAG